MLERAEFEQLWKSNYSKIYNYFYYALLDHFSAEELTSTTFFKLYENLDSYNAQKALPSTFLMSIAKNTLTDHFRKKKHISLEDIDENISYEFEDDSCDRILLGEILSELTQRERTLLYLKYYLDLSYAEISALMDISEVNARVMCGRTLKKSKKIVEKLKNSVTNRSSHSYIITEGGKEPAYYGGSQK